MIFPDFDLATGVALNEEEQQELLRLAREAITVFLRDGHSLDYETDDPALTQFAGAFVTLRTHQRPSAYREAPGANLRGCIGHMHSDRPLYQIVADMAVKAAISDPRFPEVTLDELPQLDIEISVLSPLQEVADLAEIEIGVHGLVIEGFGRRGLLLPQVPITRNWGRDEFLFNLYRKAGLPNSCWPSQAKLSKFTAQIFEEA